MGLFSRLRNRLRPPTGEADHAADHDEFVPADALEAYEAMEWANAVADEAGETVPYPDVGVPPPQSPGVEHSTPFHTRSDWGARAPRGRFPSSTFRGVTCHYMGPSPWGSGGFDHNRCASIVRGIQKFHMDSRGWTDIAYNSLACPHGHRYDGRGAGYRSAAEGTTAGNNASQSCCYLGGDGDSLPDATKRAYHDESARFRVPLRWGHRDWKSTSCPGSPLYRWRQQGFPHPGGTTPTPTPPPTQEDDLTPAESKMLRELWISAVPFGQNSQPKDARFQTQQLTKLTANATDSIEAHAQEQFKLLVHAVLNERLAPLEEAISEIAASLPKAPPG